MTKINDKNINIDKDVQIDRMQRNLGTLRKIAGWTTEELANKIGYTKQTICNLENKDKHTKMKYAQYMAFMTIFNDECGENPQNELLCKAMDVLINNPDSNEELYKQKEIYLDTLASAKYAGKKESELLAFMGMLAANVGAAAIGVGIIGAGLLFDKFFEKREEKNNNS